MKSILHQSTVLGLAMRGNNSISPLKWDDWLKLPLRKEDHGVNTPRGTVRVPTVIADSNYSQVPLCRPRFGARGIWERDGGICQYTGRKLASGEGNINHVVPRSRGGASSWENCLRSHRSVNEQKADRLPLEAGLRLLRKPQTPHALPAMLLIRNLHGVRDWQRFPAPFTGHTA